jgi:hypothetical protein
MASRALQALDQNARSGFGEAAARRSFCFRGPRATRPHGSTKNLARKISPEKFWRVSSGAKPKVASPPSSAAINEFRFQESV